MEEFIGYGKIETLFNRDLTGNKKLIEGDFRDETVKYLSNCRWYGTEKIDGTNIGVVWDGHKVTFQGRTQKSVIPKTLFAKLDALFGGNINEQLFEQMFNENKVILFGEGYGKDIQKVGKQYIPDGVDFILFDVYFPDKHLWLKRDAIENISKAFGIDVVPIVFRGTVEEAVKYVKQHTKSEFGSAYKEGIVIKPDYDIFDRLGNRIIAKVKYRDFVMEGDI